MHSVKPEGSVARGGFGQSMPAEHGLAALHAPAIKCLIYACVPGHRFFRCIGVEQTICPMLDFAINYAE